MFSVKKAYRRYFWNSDWGKISFLKGLSNSDKNRKTLPDAKYQVFAFWTGNNAMSDNRKDCLRTLQSVLDVPLVLVTPKNLDEYIVTEHPLPKGFKFLSNVHKSDYLRSYFMYYHGGGYSDIKRITKPWRASFELLNSRRDKEGLGYSELASGVGYIRPDHEFLKREVYNLNLVMGENFSYLIGNGAYIFKPGSLVFERMLEEQERRMYNYRHELEKFPGNIMGDNPGYPFRWTYLLGEIFHPIVYLLKDRLLVDDSIRPEFANYR